MFMAVIAMVLTVFNACHKDELKTLSDGNAAKVGNPGVYLENGYLVVKNMNVVDSLKKMLINKSEVEQLDWEKQLGLKSAKSFRIQSSEKFAGIQNQREGESLISELVKKGYFSQKDSSMCYPFYNYSWDCILNKEGQIKIGKVLYRFQKDAQIAVLDGKVNTLNHFIENSQSFDTSLVRVFHFQKLKSTTPVNYGAVASNSYTNDGVRFTISLYYEPTTTIGIDPYGGTGTLQTGVEYYLYFHEQQHFIAWWNDYRTYFHHQHISYDIGGNYDPIQGGYSTHIVNMTPGPWWQVNGAALANVYLTVGTWGFQIYAYPVYSTYTGPIINNFSCNSYSTEIFDQNTPLKLIIN